MAEIGIITFDPNPPGIDLDRWRKIVTANPCLRHPPMRTIVNPFTGTPTTHTPLDTDAEVLVGDVPVGAITVSLADDFELSVWAADGHHADAELIAVAIAQDLGATYTPFHDS
jgi:hypothetical protein